MENNVQCAVLLGRSYTMNAFTKVFLIGKGKGAPITGREDPEGE